MIEFRRIEVEPVRPYANSNVLRQYVIQDAKWITHPEAGSGTDQFYDFELDFNLPEDSVFVVHVSGDQRFELFCDGVYIGMGPDRSDLEHWSFHSYELTLKAGPHRLAARLQYIVTHRAHAQVSRQPAFILASEGAPLNLNTGVAGWKVVRRDGVSCSKPSFSDKWYQVVGPNFTIDGGMYFAKSDKVDPVKVPETNLQGGRVGFINDGWRLFPSRLPEQVRILRTAAGRIRMVVDGRADVMSESAVETVGGWQELVSGGGMKLKAGTVQTVLWDLDEYYCAYPRVQVSGGKGSLIRFEWAEACYMDAECRKKDDRNSIEGRYYEGYGDTFVAGGGDESFTSFWWRAGRYVRLTVEVGGADLCITGLGVEESRFPLAAEGLFACDDGSVNAIIPLAVRGIQMCQHETYMDCPYYEQMMYVGDARLQLLTSCVISAEGRLHKRALELLDWSRHVSDFVLMRHPSDPRQLSTTFSMVWLMMIRDFAWWQRDAGFVAQLLPGMRSQIEQFRALADGRMLLSRLPAWSFIDWVNSEGWSFAYPPDGEFGTSGICNLLFLLALQGAAEVEDACGEKHFAASYRDWAGKLAGSIMEVFWDEGRGLFADDQARKYFSEHAQCLAILSGMFDRETVKRCFDSLVTDASLARTSIYFSFYLLEVFYVMGRGDLILDKMDFWKDLVKKGFRAPVEQPEPSRSDCHAWGSHPLFHMHASLCGIRPDSAGFRTVRIAPCPGRLNHLECRTPHPDGMIDFEMRRIGNAWKMKISLPGDLAGTLEWGGEEHMISGKTEIEIKS